RRDARLRVLEDDHVLGGEPAVEERKRAQVPGRVRLALGDVLRRDDRLDAAREPGGADDGLDLRPGRTRDERDRYTGGRIAHGLTMWLGHARAVGDALAVERDPLLDHLVDVGVIVSEPGPHDLGIGAAGELVEVLLRGERLPVRGEELAVDRAQDRLV